MNGPGSYSMGRIIALVIACAVLCAGCAVTAHPDRIPPVRDAGPASLADIAVIVQSAQQDASPYPILTSSGVDVGFVADRKAWSRKTAEALADELARRGAQLRTTAPLKLGVAVTSITLTQTGENDQFSRSTCARRHLQAGQRTIKDPGRPPPVCSRPLTACRIASPGSYWRRPSERCWRTLNSSDSCASDSRMMVAKLFHTTRQNPIYIYSDRRYNALLQQYRGFAAHFVPCESQASRYRQGPISGGTSPAP